MDVHVHSADSDAVEAARAHFSPIANLLPVLLLGFLIATRPRPLVRLGGSILLSAVVWKLCLDYTTGDALANYYTGCGLGGYVVAIPTLLWLNDPLKDYRYNGEDVAPAASPFSKRMYYALCVFFNYRNIGWNSQVANVPPSATKNRRAFMQSRLLLAIRSGILLDLAQTYITVQPLLPILGTSAFPTGLRGYVMHTLCHFALNLCVYLTMTLQHTLLSLVCVSTGLVSGNPENWRDLFGRWSDAYTIRRFWGKTWHQLLRRHFSVCGKALAETLGFAPGTSASSYTQLYAAFAISGFLHCWGDLMLSPAHFGRSAPFFMLNAVGITFEDGVIALGRRLKPGGGGTNTAQPSRLIRAVGYAWVFLWFSFTTSVYLDWMIPLGVRFRPLPFSVVETFAPEIVIKAMRASL